MTTLSERVKAIEALLQMWKGKLVFFGLGGLVEQIVTLLRDMAREIENLKARDQ